MIAGPIVAAVVALIGIAVGWRINPPRRRSLLDEIAIRDGVNDADLKRRLDALIEAQARDYVRRRESKAEDAPSWAMTVWGVFAIANGAAVILSLLTDHQLLAVLPAVSLLINAGFFLGELYERAHRRQAS